MEEKVFETIFDKVADFLPKDWKNMVFFASYTKGSYTMKFYSENGNKKYVDCFKTPGVSKAKLIKAFMDIDKVLTPQRKELGEDKAWTVFTMKVDSEGHVKADYNYEDHSENMVAFEKEWEAKFLV